MHRRHYLVATAALAVTYGESVRGALGVVNDDAEGDEEPFPSYGRPGYSDWVPAEARNETGVVFTHLDWARLDALDHEEEGATEDNSSDDGADHENDERVDDGAQDEFGVMEEIPLLGLPLLGVFFTVFAFFGILFYPFTGDLLPDDESEAVDGVATETMSWIEDVLVFRGAYDPEAFDERYSDGFELVEERDGFAVYVGTDGFSEGLSYAVSEETLVVGMDQGDEAADDPEAAVSRALDRHAGHADRAVDDEDGRWIFETTGEAPMAFGVWEVDHFADALEVDEEDGAADEGEDGNEGGIGEDTENGQNDDGEGDAGPEYPDVEDNPVFDDVESLVSVLEFDVEDGELTDMEARFSGLYPDDAVPTEEEVRNYLLGDVPLDHDVVVAGTRVHASARFDEHLSAGSLP